MNIRNLFLAVFLSACLLYPGQKTAEKDLAEKYGDWLKLVNCIILPVEPSVFLSLTSGMDRDVFIETFWKQATRLPERRRTNTGTRSSGASPPSTSLTSGGRRGKAG